MQDEENEKCTNQYPQIHTQACDNKSQNTHTTTSYSESSGTKRERSKHPIRGGNKHWPRVKIFGSVGCDTAQRPKYKIMMSV